MSKPDKAPMKDGTGMRHMSPENVEINLMYLMAYSIWFLADDAERRLAQRNEGLHHRQKQAFNNMINTILCLKITLPHGAIQWKTTTENSSMLT